MKKYILLILTALAGFVHATDFSNVRVDFYDSVYGDNSVYYQLPLDYSNCIMASRKIPASMWIDSGCVTLSGLTLNGSKVLSVDTTAMSSTFATNSSVTSALSTKQDKFTGTTSQYVRGDGSLATYTVPVTIQRVRTSTASDGTYTWTFPQAYGTGVIPVVGITTEGSATVNYQHTITAISNTSVTIKVTPVQSVTVLGVSVLGINTATSATVHITAVAP